MSNVAPVEPDDAPASHTIRSPRTARAEQSVPSGSESHVRGTSSDPSAPAGLRLVAVPGRDGAAPVSSRFHADEFFGHQPASRAVLPRPEPLLENLTRCVVEILAGARDLEQISRWVTDDVYRHLLKRVVLSARARNAKRQSVVRPTFSIGSTTVCEPRDGVVEAVVIVHGRARTRAVAIRLEGLDSRWRATAINVL